MEQKLRQEGDRRFVGMVNCAPDPQVIVDLVRNLFANGNHIRAYAILGAGWPNMRLLQATRLLEGEIELVEALDPEAVIP